MLRKNEFKIQLYETNNITFNFSYVLHPIHICPNHLLRPNLHTYDAAGNRIQRTISGDCGHVGEMLVISDTTTKDSVLQGLKETLFPNPTTGPVSVVFNNPVSEAKITITDNLARQLYTTTASGSSIPIDMSRFAEGMCYIVVRAQGNKLDNPLAFYPPMNS